jgi:hypothetical protein
MDCALVRGVLVNKEKIRYFFTKGALKKVANSAAPRSLTSHFSEKKKKKKKGGERSSVWNALVQDETGSITVTVWGLATLHAQFSVGDAVDIVGALKPKKTNVTIFDTLFAVFIISHFHRHRRRCSTNSSAAEPATLNCTSTTSLRSTS